MAGCYLEILFTPEVLEQQAKYYKVARPIPPQHEVDLLTQNEIDFIGSRDSFYISSVTSTGWPYVQHRGGKRGFLQAIDPGTLVFADYKGNTQLLTTGNIQTNNRVSLFLMDYPQRTRLKILGHARVEDARGHSELITQFAETDVLRVVERIFFIDIVSYDWNCPKYITPRYTASEVEEALAPLRQRIAELETQLRNKS